MSLGKREGGPEAARDDAFPAAKRVKDEAPQFVGDHVSSRAAADAALVNVAAGAVHEQSRLTPPAHGGDATDRAVPQSPLDVDYIICHLNIPDDAEVARVHANTRTADKQVQAYAKLAGRNWTFYVQQLEIIIGRAAAESTDRVDIDLGPSKIISRKHAVIQYNLHKRQWEVSVLGRNGLRVDGYHLKQGMVLSLRSGHVLDVGNAQMMFVLPDAEPLVAPMFVEKARDSKLQSKPGQEAAGSSYPGEQRVGRAGPEPASSSYPRGVAIVSRPQVAAGQGFEQDLGTDECKDIKPPFSYATMITQAILSTEDHMMSLADIYAWISRHYAFYRHSKPGWQNSIRHNLSLNKAFEKVARKEHEPGKGSKWHIVPEYKEELARKATTGKHYRHRATYSPRRSPVRETAHQTTAPPPLNNSGPQSQPPVIPSTTRSQAPCAPPGYSNMPMMPGPGAPGAAPQPGQHENVGLSEQRQQQQPPTGFPMPMPFQDINGAQYPLQPFQYMQPFGMPYVPSQQPGQPPMIPMMPPMASHNPGQPQDNSPRMSQDNDAQRAFASRSSDHEPRRFDNRPADEIQMRSHSQPNDEPQPRFRRSPSQSNSQATSRPAEQPQAESESEQQLPPRPPAQLPLRGEQHNRYEQAPPSPRRVSAGGEESPQTDAQDTVRPGTQAGAAERRSHYAPGVVTHWVDVPGMGNVSSTEGASSRPRSDANTDGGATESALAGTETPARAFRSAAGEPAAQTPLGGSDVRLAPPPDNAAAPESSPALWRYMNLESTPNNVNVSANGGSSRTLAGDVVASKEKENESPTYAKHGVGEPGRESPPGSSPPGITSKGPRSTATDIPMFKAWENSRA